VPYQAQNLLLLSIIAMRQKQLKSYIPPYQAELGWKALFQEIVDSGTWPARLEVLLVAH
jgi:hypothetical protein